MSETISIEGQMYLCQRPPESYREQVEHVPETACIKDWSNLCERPSVLRDSCGCVRDLLYRTERFHWQVEHVPESACIKDWSNLHYRPPALMTNIPTHTHPVDFPHGGSPPL